MTSPHAVIERVIALPSWELLPTGETIPSGRGVYAAFATWYGRRVVRLEHHMARLLDSARRVGMSTAIDTDRIRASIARLLDDSGFDEAKIRVTVVEQDGEAPSPEAAIIVRMEPYTGPPASEKQTGVNCGLLSGVIRSTPEAKQSEWIEQRARATQSGAAPRYEWLLVDERGHISEGASSNFYLILPHRGGSPVLLTAGADILFGTARAIVLEVAPAIVPVTLRAPRTTELSAATEAFISSASRGIVPVVRIDEITIGSGAVGRVTRTLMRAYDERAEQLATYISPVAE